MARFSGWPWLATQTLRLVAKEGLQWARRIKRLLSPGAPLHDLLCLRQDDNTSVPALRQGLLPGARRVQRGPPAPATPAPTPAGPTEYTVQPGDSLASIANAYGLTYLDMLAANGLTEDQAKLLQPGDKVVIPAR